MAMTQNQPVPTQTQPGSPIRRRALLALAALGVCGAGAVAAPHVVPAMDARISDAEHALLQREIGQVEGVSLDAAIRAAELTRAAVQVIVLPLARLMSFIGVHALDGLVLELETAHNLAAAVHISTTGIDQLHDLVTSWQGNIGSLPIALDAYTTADILSAERYLKALKKATGHTTASAAMLAAVPQLEHAS